MPLPFSTKLIRNRQPISLAKLVSLPRTAIQVFRDNRLMLRQVGGQKVAETSKSADAWLLKQAFVTTYTHTGIYLSAPALHKCLPKSTGDTYV
jgi:hypothetical protein